MCDNDNNIFELEKTLHEQYAININAHTSNFVSFLVGILAIFGSYGYVYVSTCNEFANENVILNKDVFYLDALLYLSFVVNGILAFMSILSLHLGYSIRRDHLIIQKIRDKYYQNEIVKKNIFGNIYKADNKFFKNFIPEYYNNFYYLFLFSQIFIVITIAIKFCHNINFEWDICIYGLMISIVFLIFNIFLISFCFRRRESTYRKYQNNIIEYKISKTQNCCLKNCFKKLIYKFRCFKIC